ncbi:FAD-dependent oxidoreductase [Sporomusa sp.]|uniref:NAD(P)/FAD-dependent oxidoreductase n=1 Tax=Sporomusa sp. TaxID=2078658 RepID=UPI002D13216D|nr:FAD-dependent oxidoreductase [Sporomusa sp.]HWR08190.1 FAD-dependent oxidoreductase [Sporomusa sp.]
MIIEYDTIIVGGGVIGSGIAYHLSEVQPNGILVLDKDFPLNGTSGSTQGWVWIQSKVPSWYGELSMFSADLYEYLPRRIGDIEYKRTGGIGPFFTEEERELAKRLAETQAGVGIHIDILSREETLAREPSLSPDIVGSTYCSIDGNVNPMRLVEQYMRAAKKNGVTYEYSNPVVAIEKKQGSYIVTAKRGTYSCKKLILSAGVWTQAVGKMLGIDIPVFPVRGQIIVTEPVAPLFKHTLSSMRQASNGEVLIGYTKEYAGFDRSTTLDVMEETANFGVKVVPVLAKAKIVRSFAGLRVMPQDEIPIIGHIPGFDNLYIAVMHSGITLSPLAGAIITELITEGESSIPIDCLSITRFA